ncbi:LacI family DNA-binding transcriptional regulator [Pedobacter sp. Leaf194]|uniref:LacI family DNA-binding transcriptional regulator n=1 Tax=Pedobacter sp. Leaf194 TaxID=1736297 RepID=UPI000703095F|nr:LacI family DNA-binding transcriptional regulator [Pedobacter sp. Leaf194]KQS36068.1 hypothetical protein ASG14_11570 [Pedobacter sp. Leaf194]
MQKVSIKDIARISGTSVTTVSFVINGKAKEKHISESVISKIEKIVAEMAYKPNSLARGLRTGKSKIVGFLVDDISKPFFSEIARHIDEKASEHGYKIIFGSIGNDKERARDMLKIFSERQVDGYIIALPEGLENEVSSLLDSKVPMVFFDRFLPEINADFVLTDNAKATADATAHLVDNGFNNIAFITIETAQQQMLDRLEGYRNTIKRFGLKENILKIVYTDQKTTVGKIKSFLLENKDIDAVLFAANYLTMSALQLFKTKDKSLLTSKALISFDDFELLEFISPSITSIEQPIKAIAGQIFQLMLKRLDAKKNDGLQESSVIKLPASLIKRASTAAKLAKKVKLVS